MNCLIPRAFFVVVAGISVSLALLCGSRALAEGEIRSGQNPGDLRFADVVAAASKYDLVILWEGLPRDRGASAADKRPPKDKTFKIGDQEFYARPLLLSDAEARAISDAALNRASFKPWSGLKFCGGFHADYAIEWRAHGKTLAQALVCFGCGEARFLVGDRTEIADQSRQGIKLFHDLLFPHHLEQPTPPPPEGRPDLRKLVIPNIEISSPPATDLK